MNCIFVTLGQTSVKVEGAFQIVQLTFYLRLTSGKLYFIIDTSLYNLA